MPRRSPKKVKKTTMPRVEESEAQTPDVEFSGSLISATHYSGPIPPPATLEGYGKIDPTFPDRIISMAEKEQNHQHQMETKMRDNDYTLSRRGQNFAMILTLLLTGAAVFSMYVGSNIGGGIFSGTVLAFGIYAFISGHRGKKAPKQQ